MIKIIDTNHIQNKVLFLNTLEPSFWRRKAWVQICIALLAWSTLVEIDVGRQIASVQTLLICKAKPMLQSLHIFQLR